MAAPYAHIILVDCLCREQLDSVQNLTASMRQALNNSTPYCKLGAVSPDCPSLVGNTGATGYCNVMHYLRTADFVRYGIPQIFGMNFSLADTRNCIAWIFGYAAHLVVDLTIHPVVSRKFGDYAASSANKMVHRTCELQQDVYLYHKLCGKEIHGSSFMEYSTLVDCSVGGNINKLSPAIVNLWTHILLKHPPAEVKQYLRLPVTSLQPKNWYATYLNIFQRIVTKGGPYAQKHGYAYPFFSDLESKYLENLPTASGDTISYEKLFGIAMQNVLNTWSDLAAAFASEKPKPELFTLLNANLDTGLADATGKPVFLV